MIVLKEVSKFLQLHHHLGLMAVMVTYVAGAPFTEQHILVEVMKEKLRLAGFTVNQRKGMAEWVQFLALRGNQDGRIEKYGLVLLQDDRGVLPSYDAILLVSAKAAAKPGFLEALMPLVRAGGAINDAAMQTANRQVDVEGKSPNRVGLQLLELIAARQKKSDER